MKADQQVNPNISLAQFDFSVHRKDSYKTDYYTLQYPGIILAVRIWYHTSPNQWFLQSFEKA